MLSRIVMASQLQSVRWAFNCGSWSPTYQDWELLSSGMDSHDKEVIGRFVFKRDAKNAMVGRYLTKKFVSEATGLAWKDIKILRDSVHNKPYFPNSKVQFNISHSGDFVTLAGEIGNINVGVDLMKIELQRCTTIPEFFRLMAKQFVKEEWDVVNSQKSDAKQMAAFYRFWCLKESFTKATGTGITVDLQKIRFKLNDFCLSEDKIIDSTEVFVDGVKQNNWKFEESLINDDHIATVALNFGEGDAVLSSGSQLFRTLSLSELVLRYQPVSERDPDYCRKFMAKSVHPAFMIDQEDQQVQS